MPVDEDEFKRVIGNLLRMQPKKHVDSKLGTKKKTGRLFLLKRKIRLRNKALKGQGLGLAHLSNAVLKLLSRVALIEAVFKFIQVALQVFGREAVRATNQTALQ
jgi:hypothetical protein